MKKITLLLILNLSFLIFNPQKAKAQWATIPDASFVTWLTSQYPSCMNGNQMDTTCSGIVNALNVNVFAFGISNLSGIQYFDNLYTLYCTYNQLTSLPALPNSLQILECDYNQITSLPALPNTLQILSCKGNQLSSLPALPNSLQELYCFDNQLTSLPALPNSLQVLYCEYNQLSSLPTLPSSLQGLYCDYNQLTSLPSIPSGLSSLYCGNNELYQVPILPNTIAILFLDSNNITCLENLPLALWADISNNPLMCVPNQTSYSLGLPLCSYNDPVNNPNNCQGVANITGNVYTDVNINCVYNNTDLNIENIPVKLFDNQNHFLALSYTINGLFSFSALQPDSFKVKINDAVLPIDIACGAANNQTLYLDSTNQTISNINFPVVCDSTFDINVQAVTPQGWVFPGQVHNVYTNLVNNINWYNLNCSNNNYSGTVTLNVIGPITYVAPVVGALTPTVSGNTFTYNISNFNNITPSSFGIKLLTDSTAQAGNQICVHVSITTTPTDADTTNNEYNFCYNVTNSYDPNMKEVYPTNVLPGYNDWFTYTIHFQNTGTAPAFNIRLRDTLDTQLDLNTFEYLGASHTATTSLNGRNLSVRFNNIMLPDSTSNYEGSMGYYQYRIKPFQNLPNGSNIKNTAYIYFDYNPAIITNTTQNNFDILTGKSVIARRNDEAISIYPNPSTGIFTLKSSTPIKSLEVFNVIGESVLQQSTGKNINLSSQPKGIYYCKVNGSAVIKLVKE